MMQSSFDAIIVGAGPAGASAAILLSKAGLSVALVEKQAFPRRKVCGDCVSASNLPLLDGLGIAAEFNAQAGPELRRVAMMRGADTVVANLPPAPHALHAWGRALGRETLDTLLVARARSLGAVVLQPWSVQKISGAPGKHQCAVREESTGRLQLLQAPVAILAHGSWQQLPAARTAHKLARSGSDLLAFKANFRGATLPAGLLPVLAFDGGYGGMVVADHGLLTLACCIRADRLDVLRRASLGVAAGEVVEAMLKRECRGVASALDTATRCGAWLACGPLAPGVRLHRDDTVFRIGNAAGEAHPLIGEGMSMAIQSAWLLCANLLPVWHQHGDSRGAAWQAGVAARYAGQWRQHFVPRLRLSAAFAYLAMRPGASAALMATLGVWPALLTHGAAWAGKLRCAADATTFAALTGTDGGNPDASRQLTPPVR